MALALDSEKLKPPVSPFELKGLVPVALRAGTAEALNGLATHGIQVEGLAAVMRLLAGKASQPNASFNPKKLVYLRQLQDDIFVPVQLIWKLIFQN